jgi:2-methylcitrate dehydratase PrpD
VETATHTLARFASELTFDAIPHDVVRLAKQLVLDTLGTALAATTLGVGCANVASVAFDAGGPPQSTGIGRRGKIAAANAALVNGAYAHALNYDAYGHETGHTGVVAVVGPLAVAEAIAPVDGKLFLTGVVVAAEVTARIARAIARSGVPLSPRLLGGQYLGYFGVAAGCGRILGLRVERMRSALGLALMQSAGSRQVVIGGDPPAKAIYGAFPNQAGVTAALLARADLDADVDVFGGTAGVFGIATNGAFDTPSLVDGLGDDYALRAVQFKPWPTSAHVSPFVEAALDIQRDADLADGDIASVTLTGRSEIRDWFEPIAGRRRPSNPAAAANSAMFSVAHALAHRQVGLAAFTDTGLNDDAALKVAERIGYAIDDGMKGGRVTVLLRDGRELTREIGAPLGDASRPLTSDRLEAKFRDCCAHATLISEHGVNRMIDIIRKLEHLDDVSALASLLA